MRNFLKRKQLVKKLALLMRVKLLRLLLNRLIILGKLSLLVLLIRKLDKEWSLPGVILR
jgi:hypothetical protein